MRSKRGAWLCLTTLASSPPVLHVGAGGRAVLLLAGARSRHPQISRACDMVLRARYSLRISL